MGANTSHFEGLTDGEGSAERDSYYLSLALESIFNDTFTGNLYDALPKYEGTVIESANKESKAAKSYQVEIGKEAEENIGVHTMEVYREIESIFAQGKTRTHVKDFLNLSNISNARDAYKHFYDDTKKRSRLVTRIHQAFLRENGLIGSSTNTRNKEKDQSQSIQYIGSSHASGSSSNLSNQTQSSSDIMAGLAASMCVGIATGTMSENPAIFPAMANSIIQLLQSLPPESLSTATRSNASSVVTKTVCQIEDLAKGILNSKEMIPSATREEAMSVLLAVAYSTGSLERLIEVVKYVYSFEDQIETKQHLFSSSAKPFLDKLRGWKTEHNLDIVKPNLSIETFKLDAELPKETERNISTLSVDRESLFIWDEMKETVLRISNGFFTSVHGNVLASNDSLQLQIDSMLNRGIEPKLLPPAPPSEIQENEENEEIKIDESKAVLKEENDLEPKEIKKVAASLAVVGNKLYLLCEQYLGVDRLAVLNKETLVLESIRNLDEETVGNDSGSSSPASPGIMALQIPTPIMEISFNCSASDVLCLHSIPGFILQRCKNATLEDRNVTNLVNARINTEIQNGASNDVFYISNIVEAFGAVLSPDATFFAVFEFIEQKRELSTTTSKRLPILANFGGSKLLMLQLKNSEIPISNKAKKKKKSELGENLLCYFNPFEEIELVSLRTADNEEIDLTEFKKIWKIENEYNLSSAFARQEEKLRMSRKPSRSSKIDSFLSYKIRGKEETFVYSYSSSTNGRNLAMPRDENSVEATTSIVNSNATQGSTNPMANSDGHFAFNSNSDDDDDDDDDDDSEETSDDDIYDSDRNSDEESDEDEDEDHYRGDDPLLENSTAPNKTKTSEVSKHSYPMISKLINDAIPHILGQKLCLEGVVLEPRGNVLKSYRKLTFKLPDSIGYLLKPEQLESNVSVYSNGEEIIMHEIEQNVRVCVEAEKKSFSVRSHKFNQDGEWLITSSNSFGLKSSFGVPQGMCYDVHNNLLWGFSPNWGVFTRWRNSGIAPVVYMVEDKESSGNIYDSDPIVRLKAIDKLIQHDQSKIVATSLLTMIDNIGADHGILFEKPPVDQDLLNSLTVSSRGATNGSSGNDGSCRIELCGQVILDVPDIKKAPDSNKNRNGPIFNATRGIYVITLDEKFELVERNFFGTFTDTKEDDRQYDSDSDDGSNRNKNMLSDGPEMRKSGDNFCDFLEIQPPGRIVLITSTYNANSSYFPERLVGALSSVGMTETDAKGMTKTNKSREGTSLCLIGYKGAKQGYARYYFGNGSKKVVQRTNLGAISVPLCIQPDKNTLCKLIDLCFSIKQDLLKTDSPELTISALVSTLNILSVNLYQVKRGNSMADLLRIVGNVHRKKLRDLINYFLDLKLEDVPSEHAYNALGQATAKVFNTAISLLYPRPSDKYKMLIDLVDRYSKGKLPPRELEVLNQILTQSTNPQAIAGLLKDIMPTKKNVESSFDHSDDDSDDDSDEDEDEEDDDNESCHETQKEEKSEINVFVMMESIFSAIKLNFKDALSDIVTPENSKIGPKFLLSGSAASQFVNLLSTSIINSAIYLMGEEHSPVDASSNSDSKDVSTPSNPPVMVRATTSQSLPIGPLKGLAMYVDLLKVVVGFAKEMSKLATVALDALGMESSFHPEIQQILKESPMQTLLPTLLLAMSSIGKLHSAQLLLKGGNEVLQQMYELSSSLKDCESLVNSLLKRVPGKEQVVGFIAQPTVQKAMKYFESPHEYLPNMNVCEDVNLPGAHKIIITFDERTRTETGCDVVRIYNGNSGELGQYHGRGSDRAFPGLDNRPPLEINGDSFSFKFTTDGSGQDWGYKMNVEIHSMVQLNSVKLHWLRVLDQEVGHCITVLAKHLIQSTPIQKSLEEVNEAVITNKIINPDLFLLGKEGKSEEDQLLFGLVNQQEGSLALHLIEGMKRAVREDQGQEVHINRAVYSTCAAIIKYNGLASEALAIAKSRATADPANRIRPSDKLLKAWRAGQNMRKFFQLAELKEEVVPKREFSGVEYDGGSTTRRAIGLYDGADNTVIEAASNIVVNKARFLLLTLQDEDKKENANDSLSETHFRAKSNWTLLKGTLTSQTANANDIVSRPPSLMRSDSAPIPVKRSHFFDVVKSAVAADRLKNMISFRRRWAKSYNGGESSITEQVLALMQNHVDILELQRLHDVRTQRVQARSLGLRLLSVRLKQIMTRAVELDIGDGGQVDRERILFSITTIMTSITEALRNCPAVATSSASDFIHIKKSSVGAPNLLLSGLDNNFEEFLKESVRALNFCFENYCREKNSEPKSRWNSGVRLILVAFAFDYERSDNDLLDKSNIINALLSILSRIDEEAISLENSQIQLNAKELLQLIAARCPSSDKYGVDGPSGLSKHLMQSLCSEVQKRATASQELANTSFFVPIDGFPTLNEQLNTISPVPNTSHLSYSVVENITPIRGCHSDCSYVFNHVDDAVNHSFSLWLKRDASLFESKLSIDKKREEESFKSVIENNFEINACVMRGLEQEWIKGPKSSDSKAGPNDDDGGAGGLGLIKSVEVVPAAAGSDAEAKKVYQVWWQDTQITKKYELNQLALADNFTGGHIFSKGAPNLMDLSPPEGQKNGFLPPWSLYGLNILPNGTLSSFVSKGTEVIEGKKIELGFETLRCTKQFPVDEWVHVTCTQNGLKASLSFKGSSCEEKIESDMSPTMTMFQESFRDYIEIESEHPYLDNVDKKQTVEENGAEGYEISFSENSRTEHNYDWCKFLRGDGNNSDDPWGRTKYSGTSFPGMNGNPPLEIEASKFCFQFHSDGSGNDWGFKIHIKVKRSEDFMRNIAKEQENFKPKFLNRMSLYVGHRPYYVGNSYIPTRMGGFTGSVASLRIYPQTALNEKHIKFLEGQSVSRKISPAAIALKYPTESGLVYSLSALSKGINSVLEAGPDFLNQALQGDTIGLVNTLFVLAKYSDSMSAKDISWTLLAKLIPYLNHEIIGNQASKVGFCLTGCDSTTAFISYLFQDVGISSAFSGAVQGSALHNEIDFIDSDETALKPCKDSSYGIAKRKLTVLHQISVSKDPEWRSALASVVKKTAEDAPRLFNQLQQLRKVQEKCIPYPNGNHDSQLSKDDRDALYCIYGLVAFFGGTFDSIQTGTHATYEREGSISEECCVLGQFAVPRTKDQPKARSNQRAAKDDALERRKFWDGLGNFGEACIISLVSHDLSSEEEDKAHQPLLVPRRNLKFGDGIASSKHLAISDFITKDVGKKCIVDFMHEIVALETQDHRPQPESLPFSLRESTEKSSKEKDKKYKKTKNMQFMDFTRKFESRNHSPYDLKGDPEPTFIRISIPGAKKMIISFDQRTSLKPNHDLLLKYGKDFTEQRSFYGRGPIPSVTNSEPLCKESVLIVESDEVHMELTAMEPGQYEESDEVLSHWGWAVTVTASIEEGVNVKPPCLPVLPVLGLLSHVKMLGMRALTTFLNASNSNAKDGQDDWFVREALTSLSGPLLKNCLAPLTCLGGVEGANPVRTEEFETPHPYSRRQDTVTHIYIKGASKLKLRFDDQTKTEQGADYVKLFLDSQCSNKVPGSMTYSGGMNGSSQNFPGCCGNEQLEVEGDTCYMTFHSDGSEEDWGYLLYVTEVMNSNAITGGAVENTSVHIDMGHENALLAAFNMQKLYEDGPRVKGNTSDLLSSTQTAENLVNSLRLGCYPHSIPSEYGPGLVQMPREMESDEKCSAIKEHSKSSANEDRIIGDLWPMGYSIECRPSSNNTSQTKNCELKIYPSAIISDECTSINSKTHRLLAFPESHDPNWIKVCAIPLSNNTRVSPLKLIQDGPKFAGFDEKRLLNTETFAVLQLSFASLFYPVHLSSNKQAAYTTVPNGVTTMLEGQSSAVSLHSDTGFNLKDITSVESTGNYVEFTIAEFPDDEEGTDTRPGCIGIGMTFADREITFNREKPINPNTELQVVAHFIGWSFGTYGFHSDDSSRWGHADESVATSSESSQWFGDEKGTHGYGKGDVIGVGLDFESRHLFYTRNGVKLSSSCDDRPDRSDKISDKAFESFVSNQDKLLYPALSFDTNPGPVVIEMNSGQHPFMYQPTGSEDGLVKLSSAAKLALSSTGQNAKAMTTSSSVEVEGWVNVPENTEAILVNDFTVPGAAKPKRYAPVLSSRGKNPSDSSTICLPLDEWVKKFGKYEYDVNLKSSIMANVPLRFKRCPENGELVDCYGDILSADSQEAISTSNIFENELSTLDSSLDFTESAILQKKDWEKVHPLLQCSDKVIGVDDNTLAHGNDHKTIDEIDVIRSRPGPKNDSKELVIDQYIERSVWQFSSIAISSYSTKCLFHLMEAWPAELPFSVDIFASTKNGENQSCVDEDGMNNFLSIIALGLEKGQIEAIRPRFLSLLKNVEGGDTKLTSNLLSFAVKELDHSKKDKIENLEIQEKIPDSLRSSSVVKVLESNHPYNITSKQLIAEDKSASSEPSGIISSNFWSVSIPDAKYLLVTFDENCCTSEGDSLAIYTDTEAESAEAKNPDFILGGRRPENWPFLSCGISPLRINATSAAFEFRVSDRSIMRGDDEKTKEVLEKSADSLRNAGVNVDDERYSPVDCNNIRVGGGFTTKNLLASVAGPEVGRKDSPHEPLMVPYWGFKIVVYGITDDPDEEAVNQYQKNITVIDTSKSAGSSTFNNFISPLGYEMIPAVLKPKLKHHLSCWLLHNLITLPSKEYHSVHARVLDPAVIDALWHYLGFCVGGTENKVRITIADYTNAGGVEMKASGESGEQGMYCGRNLGRNSIPGSDGQCGPNNGPMCGDCKDCMKALKSKQKECGGTFNDRFYEVSNTLGIMMSQITRHFSEILSNAENGIGLQTLFHWAHKAAAPILNKLSSMVEILARVVTELKENEDKGSNSKLIYGKHTQTLSSLSLSASRCRDSIGEIYPRILQILSNIGTDTKEENLNGVLLIADASSKETRKHQRWLEPMGSMYEILASMDTYHRVPHSIINAFFLPMCSEFLRKSWKLDSIHNISKPEIIEIPGSYGLLLHLDSDTLCLGPNQQLVISESMEGDGCHKHKNREVLKLSGQTLAIARKFMFKAEKFTLDTSCKASEEGTEVNDESSRRCLFKMIAQASASQGGAAGLLHLEHGLNPILNTAKITGKPDIALNDSESFGLSNLFALPSLSSSKSEPTNKTEPTYIKMKNGLLVIGSKVVRGPDWNRGALDGGRGSEGVIIKLGTWENKSEGEAITIDAAFVAWGQGEVNDKDKMDSSGSWYRYGFQNQYDLTIVTKDSSKEIISEIDNEQQEQQEEQPDAPLAEDPLMLELSLLKSRLVADCGVVCIHGNKLVIEVREVDNPLLVADYSPSDDINKPLSLQVYPLLWPKETLRRCESKTKNEQDEGLAALWTQVKQTFGAGNKATDDALWAHVCTRSKSDKHKDRSPLTSAYSSFEPTEQELQQSPHLNNLWQLNKSNNTEETNAVEKEVEQSHQMSTEAIESMIDRSEGWTCPVCTYINMKNKENECEMCGRKGDGDPYLEMQHRMLEEQSNSQVDQYGSSTDKDSDSSIPLPKLLWDITADKMLGDKSIYCKHLNRLNCMFTTAKITERESMTTEYNKCLDKECSSADRSKYIEWPISPIAARFYLLQSLNSAFKVCLAQLDATDCADPSITNALKQSNDNIEILDSKLHMNSSLSELFNKHRNLFLPSIKMELWDTALKNTKGRASEFNLAISRSRSRKYADMGEVDTEGRWTTFSQAFRVLYPMSPTILRHEDKIYSVQLAGEFADDYGGPYRESFDGYCGEIQSSIMSLMCQTPNGRHVTGINREKWLLNPGAKSHTEIKMLAFFGKLMGVAIRSKGYLPLNIPLFIWKLIVGERPTLKDLEDIDQPLVRNFLHDFRNIHETMDEEAFNVTFYETFTTIGTDGAEVELVRNGADKNVTFENRNEYCDLVENFRLHEFDKQAAAVRAGLGTVVPAGALNLLTGSELEILVCGNPEIDLELLKSCTEYRSCQSNSQHVQFFWQAMESFNTEERQAFIRFVWGRSRLPLTAAGFSSQFRIQGFGQSPADAYFPVAHTCFFSFELPAYSTLEIMKEKLLYAIFNCVAIDGDDTGAGVNAANMGWEE